MENVIGSESTTPQSTPATPSAPAPAASTPDFAAATPATPQVAPQAPASGVPQQQPEPSWLRGRLEEARRTAVTRAQAEWQRKENDYQAQLQQIQRQLHAVVGVTPQGDPQIEAVRQQFAQLYPGLAQLEQHAQELMQIREQAGNFETQQQHYWTSYGRQVMDRLFDRAQASVGSPLTNEAKRQLHSSFVGYLQSNPDLAERYANDPSVVEDFWKEFTSNFIDPARRGATAQVQTRVENQPPVPRDTGGGIPRPATAPTGNSEDKLKIGWAQYLNTAKPTDR